MTRKKKHPKRASKKKITGTIIKLTPNKIRVATAKATWSINRTPRPKVIKGTLRLRSRVTVEFNKNDGKIVERLQPGKRTEIGTVIGLNAQRIALQVPSISQGFPGAGTPGTFLIDRHPGDTTVISGKLAVGSVAEIESNEEDWHQVAAA